MFTIHAQPEGPASVARTDPISGKNPQRFESFTRDARDAMAAAVVDVFSCDYHMDRLTGAFGTSRGMERQIGSFAGRDPAAVVAELRRQCSKWSG